MNGIKVLIFTSIILTFVLMSSVYAIGIEYYGIESRLEKNLTVKNTVTLAFNHSISNFDYPFKNNIYNLEIESKYDFADCTPVDNVISCKFVSKGEENRTQITFEFETRDNIKIVEGEYKFEVNYPIDNFVHRIFNMVYLPETATLSTSIPNESFSPRYGKTGSDGRHIVIYWEREDIKPGDDLYFSVSYKIPVSEMPMGSIYGVAITVVIAVIIIVALGIFYMKSIRKESIEVVMPLLKRDEKKIIDILRERGRTTNQRVLVRETDFSKAKVSRLVASLKERGIIDVEHIGRTNKVTLRLKG
jgi:uncharacterized membrane protein